MNRACAGVEARADEARSAESAAVMRVFFMVFSVGGQGEKPQYPD